MHILFLHTVPHLTETTFPLTTGMVSMVAVILLHVFLKENMYDYLRNVNLLIEEASQCYMK